MGKFRGKVGYAESKETSPGIWEDVITERNHSGDVFRNVRRSEDGKHLNDNLNVDNVISIVSDAYSYQNFFSIRYVKWGGASWSVTRVEVQRPRLILTLGGVYNGETP